MPSSIRPGRAVSPAAARIVSASSTFKPAGCDAHRAAVSCCPSSASSAAGGSTARRPVTLPVRTRCSPWKKPLSVVKMISVSSSSPVERSVSMIDSSPRRRPGESLGAAATSPGCWPAAAASSRSVAGSPRLVRDVYLVEVRRRRQWHVREAVLMARRRHRRRGSPGIARLARPAGVVGEEGDPEEERPFRCASADDLVRLVAVDVGLVARRLRDRAVRRQVTVLVERVVVVAVGRRVDGAAPLAPAGWNLGGFRRP